MAAANAPIAMREALTVSSLRSSFSLDFLSLIRNSTSPAIFITDSNHQSFASNSYALLNFYFPNGVFRNKFDCVVTKFTALLCFLIFELA